MSVLRTVKLPSDLVSSFLHHAKDNSDNGSETLGLLGGRLRRDNKFRVTHLLLPNQPGHSLTPAQSSVSRCLLSQFPPLPDVCQAPTELNTSHITPESFESGPAANIDIDPLIEPLPVVLRFIKISVRF